MQKMENHYQLHSRGALFESVVKSAICSNADNQHIELEKGLEQFSLLLRNTKENQGAIYLIGNGGSAAVASHAITDFVNVCQLRAFTLHDSSLMTCMANDFGYDQAFKRIVSTVLRKQDLLIAISSSGQSANICNAAKVAKMMGSVVVTLSGFHADNPLRKMGHYNFWLDCCDYGLVEIGHLFILHNLADRDHEAIALKNNEKIACAVAPFENTA